MDVPSKGTVNSLTSENNEITSDYLMTNLTPNTLKKLIIFHSFPACE